MSWIEIFTNSKEIFLSCIGIFGLFIGSFLNVLIFRLPKMLKQEWKLQAIAYLQENDPTVLAHHHAKPAPIFNLMTPRSRCPHCEHPLSILENIPVLSFLFLKGRCKACHHRISWRYPFIEILTAFLSVIIAHYFGFTYHTLWALVLTWSLITLSMIDIDHHLLPDNIIFPLLWLGLTLNLNSFFTDLTTALLGVIFGYLFFWGVFWIFKIITHQEGMGYGDFKLLAMLGAWLGWQALPNIILLSSLVGAMVGVTLILFKKHTRQQPLPFGPYLAFAGWISLIWGGKINDLYLSFVGLI